TWESGLEIVHQSCCSHCRIDGHVRLRSARSAMSAKNNGEGVGGSQQGSDGHVECVGWEVGLVVQAVDRIHGKPLKKAVAHHCRSAPQTFLSRLENEVDSP